MVSWQAAGGKLAGSRWLAGRQQVVCWRAADGQLAGSRWSVMEGPPVHVDIFLFLTTCDRSISYVDFLENKIVGFCENSGAD